MEELEKPEYAVLLIVGLIGFLGAVIGSLVSPWVMAMLERKKTKRELKSYLINQVARFYSIRKADIHYKELDSLYDKRVDLALEELVKAQNQEINSEVLHTHYHRLLELHKNSGDRHNEYFKMAMDVEAELESLFSKINTYFGATKYDLVVNLLRPEILISNTAKVMNDYRSMTGKQLVGMNFNFEEQIYKRQVALGERSIEVCQQIDSIL